MGRFVRGDIVVFPFPFSDLSAHKRRPVLVVKDLVGIDFIVCPITTKKILRILSESHSHRLT